MSAETAFVALMKATGTVTAIIGTAGNARVSENRIEQDDVLPAVIYRRAATENFVGLDGTINDSKVTLEVECWADTAKAAAALADAIQAAIVTAQQFNVGRGGESEDTGDLACTVLTIDWWE